MKRIIIFLLIPYCSYAQQNYPILPITSADYNKLIKPNFASTKDTLNSFSKATIQQNNNSYTIGRPLKSITIKNNQLHLKLAQPKTVQFGISYSLTSAINIANNQPKLQNTYVQGQTNAGNIIWQGAELNVPFSYGPNINSLHYDGSNYAYDGKGKLINSTDGGTPATPYNNSIIKTGYTFTQSLHAQGKLSKLYNNFYELGILYNNNFETLTIPFNQNKNQNISITANKKIKNTTITVNYFIANTAYSNANNNGFLNKMYANSLITPISFSNIHNNKPNAIQQSFYANANNPYFMLNNSNSYKQNNNRANFTLQQTINKFYTKLAANYQQISDNTIEITKPFTAYFSNGNNYNSNIKNNKTNIQAIAKYSTKANAKNQEIEVNNNTQFENNTIQYVGTTKAYYKYNRINNITKLSYFLNIHTFNNSNYGAKVSNTSYVSNTSSNNILMQPFVTFFYKTYLNNNNKTYLKINASYDKASTEPSITQSLAHTNLLLLQPWELNKFMPTTEVQSYKNIALIKHNSFNTIVEMCYNNRWTLTAELYTKKINNDVFPIANNNELHLKNIANHKTNGIEIEIQYSNNNYKKEKPNVISCLSFNKYRTIITKVLDGYNGTPIAGFANVHKAIVKGQQLGIIMGNTFLKNNENKTIIDADGFPIMDNNVKIIGNATPKFIVKSNNSISYKKWNLNVDCEWKNGGQIWNGTQAVLDYFGMSKLTEQQRTVQNYIYEGVTINGNINTKPINFYDKNLPVTQNNWTRYGYTGIAQNYIQKADQIKLNNLSIAYNKMCKKHIQQYSVGIYTSNMIVWSAYKGVDSNQLLFDQPNSQGLDFFNLPSSTNIGITLNIKY